MARHFLGIDVGTGSARTGVFNERGDLLASAKQPIAIWHEAGGVVEQSSDGYLAGSLPAAVRKAVERCGDPIRPPSPASASTPPVRSLPRRGLAPDAASALQAMPNRNIIVWMDHRAAAEADEINGGGHDVLRYVGGRISPEMETPKLLWLKRHLPQQYRAAAHFFDLSDYLTWRATGSQARSVCTVTCKWTLSRP